MIIDGLDSVTEAVLAELKHALNVPIATDVHEIDQVEPVAAIADLVQIPAFLCRQTDLVVAAARATSARASAKPSALSPFIFQLPAISLRTRDLHQRARSTTPSAPAASGQQGSHRSRPTIPKSRIPIDFS